MRCPKGGMRVKFRLGWARAREPGRETQTPAVETICAHASPGIGAPDFGDIYPSKVSPLMRRHLRPTSKKAKDKISDKHVRSSTTGNSRPASPRHTSLHDKPRGTPALASRAISAVRPRTCMLEAPVPPISVSRARVPPSPHLQPAFELRQSLTLLVLHAALVLLHVLDKVPVSSRVDLIFFG